MANNAEYLIMDSGGAIELGKQRKSKYNNRGKSKTKEKAHVDLSESSQMEKEANVKHLVLTHVDEEATTAEIRKNYIGKILYAKDLMVLPYEDDVHSHDGTSHSHNNQHLPDKKLFPR